MKKFNTLRLDLAEKTLTPAEKKKREEIAMAMERENPGMPMGKKMAIATAAAKRVAEENLDEISTKTLASAAKSASDPDSDYHYGKSHDPQKFADHAKKTKDAKSAAAVQGAADAKGHYTRPGHTIGSYDKLAHRTPARVTSTGKANKQDVKTLKGSIKRNEEVESIDELKSSTLTSYIDKVATGPSRGNKNIKAISGVTTAIRKRAENENPPFEPDPPKKNPSAVAGKYGIGPSIAAHLAKKGMKNVLNNVNKVNEEIKTTHEDPLVVVKDAEGNILTHANRSVAGDIHGINVSHHTIHTGMPVEVVDRDGKKLTVQKSMHHDSEVAKDSASAVKEAKEKTEYDYEGDMARSQLQSIVMNAQKVHDMLKDNDNLPEWVQSKITLAEDYILTVSNYMATEIDEETNKEYTHKVVHNKTGNIVGKYTSLKAATRAADKKDNAYGGYAHQVRRIDDEKTIDDKETEIKEEKPGLWANIHAKRKRIASGSGERMRTPGSEGAPRAQDFKDAAKTSKNEEVQAIEETSHTFEPATHKPTVKTSKGHSFEGNTYNAKGLKGASIYKHKDTGKYYANKIDANTTFHSSAKEAADKYHTKAK